MSFPYDKYPWLNFQELNLAYFIRHFREIFQQWDQLYHDLLDWKNATDADLAEWKTTVESGISSWETGLTDALDTWKTQTQTDIGTWEAATLTALDAWKTATTLVFEQIRTEAAASATSAAGSASAAETAKTAAQTAQAAAEAAAASISASLQQISENSGDIATLKNTVSIIAGVVEINFTSDHGYDTTGTSIDLSSPTQNNAVECAYAECSPGDTFSYTGKGSNSYRNYAFLNANYEIIERSAAVYVENIGQGVSPEEAVKQVGMVVEGINALPAAVALAKKYDVEMPITETAYDIIFGGIDPKSAVMKLMLRDKKAEVEEG